jgi:hypothetical protein
MADWSTISSLATAGGTLALAVATFVSMRIAVRSTRVAEAALIEQRRPVLVQSRLDDPVQKIMFVDRRWVRVEGSSGVAEHTDGVVYLALSLRNIGSGIAVMQAWAVSAGLLTSDVPHVPIARMRRQGRDLYIPAGDVGLWQGALRDPADPVHSEIVEACDSGKPISIEMMYSDQIGDQRSVRRITLVPTESGRWLASTGPQWELDRPSPRR